MRLEEFEINEGPLAKKLGNAALAGAALIGMHQTTKPGQAMQTPTISQPSIDQGAAKIMAQTMWGEARNQGEEGMRAVGHVIKNRAEENRPKLFGSGIEGVAHAPKQFSAWNKGDPNRRLMQNVDNLQPGDPGYNEWQEAQQIAADILAGKDRDNTNGSLYYHTKAVNPHWAKKIDPVKTIGDHLFYNEIPRA